MPGAEVRAGAAGLMLRAIQWRLSAWHIHHQGEVRVLAAQWSMWSCNSEALIMSMRCIEMNT